MDYKKFKKDCIEYYIEISMQYFNNYYSEFKKNQEDFTELDESKRDKLREFASGSNKPVQLIAKNILNERGAIRI